MDVEKQVYAFSPELVEGLIVKRKNRFIFVVEIGDIAYECHCPVTGSIGNIVFDNIPCLLSKSQGSARKTPYTVEAISLDPPGTENKSWVGINQNLVNRYVETAFRSGLLADVIGGGDTILREQVLGNSKLDFRIGGTYIEVKTPLNDIQVPTGPHIVKRKVLEATGPNRFVRHIGELSDSLGPENKAILLVCFIYDNPRFTRPAQTKNSGAVRGIVAASVARGVEIWQVNFALSAAGVRLARHFEITSDFA